MSKNNSPEKKSEVATQPTPNAAKVEQVLKWIVAGASEYEIEEACEEHWKGEDSKPLVIAAMQKAQAAADADPKLIKGWCFEAARHVYSKALASGDYGAALRALKMIGDTNR